MRVPGIFAVAITLLPAPLDAQGVATAGIRGNITTTRAAGVRPPSQIHVKHEATGFSIEVTASNGSFFIQGVEPGGPYTITARALGYAPERRTGLFLTLGELRRVDFVLHPIAAQLDTIRVSALNRYETSGAPTAGGTGMRIPASTLERLPTLNRDLYDFVRLVPQISTKISLSNPGLSAGGIGFRFNNFLINGVSERSLSGGVSTAFGGGKSIPLDAVQEYQVLLAPYDVRYGDFAGALVNAVTKSGTNQFRGSAFVYGRNDQLARRTPGAARAPYEKVQYGFSLGGPILRDRLHFFIAPELQRFTFPADGPYVGQSESEERPVPVSLADLDRFTAMMASRGLTAGSAGPIENSNPLRNLFTRVDLALPGWKSRLLLWNNFGASEESSLSRAARDTFSLASYQVTRSNRTLANAAHLHTTLSRRGGGHNEILLSHRSQNSDPTVAVQQPIVRVSVQSVSGGLVTLITGTHESAQASWVRSSTLSVKDNLTLPLGSRNVATLGMELERFALQRGRAPGTYGAWSFPSLDAFERGVADRYEIRLDLGNPTPAVSGTQYAAYAGNQWQASDRLSVTAGIRADWLSIAERAPYNRLVDSVFGRRTDEMPRERIELSPRAGFTWDIAGTQQHHIRGGAGIFTGRYPLAWAHSALGIYGVGGVLRCSRQLTAVGTPPVFSADVRSPPMTCAEGATITAEDPGDVNLLARNLRMMRIARGSLAYDRTLARDFVLTGEVLATRALSDFVVSNLNLSEPVGTDANGRVLYGAVGPNGLAAPRYRSKFTEVIDIANAGRNRSLQLSGRLEKVQSTGLSGSLSYAFSRVRDVQTPTRVNTRGTMLWASARVISGRHDQLPLGISANDVPHRVILAGRYLRPWIRGHTEVSFYYVGESGRPFTYMAFGTLGRGDLNADGSNGNDPIYVPRDAGDPSEIVFSGISDSSGADTSLIAQLQREQLQRAAFESFVERTSCLRTQRGRIVERNSCRESWSNTTIASLRQSIPFGGRAIEVQLDVFNVLNLLNREWGLYREASPALLEHTGQIAGTSGISRPVFRFNASGSGETTLPVESAFQLQLALRYRL